MLQIKKETFEIQFQVRLRISSPTNGKGTRVHQSDYWRKTPHSRV